MILQSDVYSALVAAVSNASGEFRLGALEL